MTETFNNVVMGLGVTFSFTPSGSSLTSVTQLQSVEAPSIEMGTWESTGLASTSKEYVPTIPDGGEVTLVIIYDPSNANHALIPSTLYAKKLCACSVNFPAAIGPSASATSAHSETFNAYFTGFQATGMEVESGVIANVKLKVTGDVTFA